MALNSALTLLLIVICFKLQSINTSAIEATLPFGQSIGNSDSLVSPNGNFRLGFFSKQNSTKYYVGILFNKISNSSIVWVANRSSPFLNSSVVLKIYKDGNLVISGGQTVHFVTNISTTSSTKAMLLDSGNLVLLNNSDLGVLWQSFDYPTDTLLPGMSVGRDPVSGLTWSLTSWTSAEDPAPGIFSLHVDAGSDMHILKDSEVYWIGDNSSNFTFVPSGNRSNGDWSPVYYFLTWQGKYGSRLVLETSGELNQLLWSEHEKKWDSLQSSKCGTQGLCGNFSICNPQFKNPCDCLHGFKPYDEESWKQGNTSAGCVRKTELLCSNTGRDAFFPYYGVDFTSIDGFSKTKDVSTCRRTCSSSCSCLAYAYKKLGGCLLLYEPVLNLKNISVDVRDDDQISFFLKLDASELVNSGTNTTNGTESTYGGHKFDRSQRHLLIIVLLISFVALLSLGLFVYYYRRRRQARQWEDLLQFDVGMSMKIDNSAGNSEADSIAKVDRREVKLPFFSFASVSAATDNFSAENKLGEGGFGPVYKGKLLNGDEVAVKRLSRRSGQGWGELRNEALLIAKLQHNNLVRLLGCCIERDEKMLIYEFMPNKSLDFFLFDETKSRTLDWSTRVQIIDGIAQGLLYLHQYSRFRIIHRDLKASNILLDINMNPKISDFGMAKIFGRNELQANTNRIVVTYGYMSPEYALEGLFSIKSDVFSFGVLLLEILSGKKNTGFYQTNSFNLLGYAWDLWTSERGVELLDPVLQDASMKDEVVLRYVNIALLCVQERAADRPTMSDVVSMLGNHSAVLPFPKPTAFLNVMGIKHSKTAGSSDGSISANTLTVSVMEAR